MLQLALERFGPDAQRGLTAFLSAFVAPQIAAGLALGRAHRWMFAPVAAGMLGAAVLVGTSAGRVDPTAAWFLCGGPLFVAGWTTSAIRRARGAPAGRRIVIAAAVLVIGAMALPYFLVSSLFVGIDTSLTTAFVVFGSLQAAAGALAGWFGVRTALAFSAGMALASATFLAHAELDPRALSLYALLWTPGLAAGLLVAFVRARRDISTTT